MAWHIPGKEQDGQQGMGPAGRKAGCLVVSGEIWQRQWQIESKNGAAGL